MPKFDKIILSAIEKAVDASGSQAALCKKTGISTSMMSKYLKGDVVNINLGTWNILFPVIKEFLPEHYHRQFLNWKSSQDWEKFAESFPEVYKKTIETMNDIDIDAISKTDPLFGRSDEFIATIRLIEKKLPHLKQKTLDNILSIAISEINGGI